MVVTHEPLSWLRVVFQVRGTILRRIWGRVAFVTAVALAVTVWHGIEPLSATLTTTPFSLIGLAVSIVLGFRNGKCFERYWEARILWGGLVNTSRTWTRQVLTLLDPAAVGPAAPGAAEAVERTQRLLVLRACAFAHALRLALRGRARDLGELERLLGAEEVAALAAAPNPAYALVAGMGERLAHARRQGWVHPLHVGILDASLAELTNVQGGCERIKNTPMPFAYSLLIHRLVGLYCLALPFGIIDSVQQFTPLVVALVAYAFLGLDAVGDEIEDPFGTDDQDLPLDQLSTMIEINLRERLGDTDLPAPVQPVNGILL